MLRRFGVSAICILSFCFLPSAIYLDSSHVLAQAIDSRKTQADQFYKEADQFINSYMFQAAQLKLEQALSLYRQLADTTGQRNTLVSLAYTYYGMGRYREALEYLRQAEAIPGDRSQEGRLLTVRGFVTLEMGDYREAYFLFQRSSGSQIQDLVWENRNRIGLGESYRYLGWYSRAIAYLDIAGGASGNRGDYGRSLNAIGDAYFDLGQYEDAENHYQQALAVRQSIGDKMGAIRTLNNLGRVEREKGALPEALKYYQTAIDWAASLGDTASRGAILSNMGQVALDMGLNNQALNYFQQALDITRNAPSGRVQALIGMGLYHRKQGDYEKAIAYYQEAIGWANKNGDRVGEAKALSGLGETQLEMKKTSEAIATLNASIELFESLRPGLRDDEKISLFDTQAATYRALQAALVAGGDSTTALTVAERGRARAFVELLAKRVSATFEIDAEVKPPTVEDIQTIARKQQATLVTYSIIYDGANRETGLYIWVVDAQGNVNFRQVDLKQNLTDLVLDLRDTGIDDDRTLTRQAYDILIAPIADLLPADPRSRVVFIPQGSLFLVPFQALQDASGKFLIEKHTILFAPSIQALTFKQQPDNQSTTALVVGNPEPMPEELSPLPGAETEAQEVAQILATQPLVRTAATETTVLEKMSQARIIHFATHGLLNDREALTSSLAFAPSQGTDGLLTAGEIFDLKLQADLAVLSACDTGRGKITGDGVVGLSRSLLSAGVPSVVVSLWEVPDQPTANLMVEFYRNLQQTPDKAQALRQAMLTQMKQTPNPRDWAAFILIGSAD